MRNYIFFLLICLLLFSTTVFAQEDEPERFQLTWSWIGSGGGVSSSGDKQYTLTNTISEPVTGESKGDRFALTSGYMVGAKSPATLVLLYINGDNNLASHIHKLVQKVHIGAVNSDVVVYLVLDWPGGPNSYLYEVDKGGETNCNFRLNYRCGNRYKDGENVWSFDENLGEAENLSKFVNDALAKYPDPEQVVLSLVGHGGGWSPERLAGQPQSHVGKTPDEIGGLLWDDYTSNAINDSNNEGRSLSTFELGEAVKMMDRHIDLLFLDACLMGMWEVAYQVREDVRYLLASESWSWTSFAYDDHLLDITGDQSTATIGGLWLENEAAFVRNIRYPFTYSLTDLAQMPALKEQVDALSLALDEVLDQPNARLKIKAAYQASECFDSNADHEINQTDDVGKNSLDNYCDLSSFAKELSNQFKDNAALAQASQAVQTVVANAVVHKDHECGVPYRYSSDEWCWQELGGLSIYVPLGQDNWKRGVYGQVDAAGDRSKQIGWDYFLHEYWKREDAPGVAACAPPCALPLGPLPTEHQVFLPAIQR